MPPVYDGWLFTKSSFSLSNALISGAVATVTLVGGTLALNLYENHGVQYEKIDGERVTKRVDGIASRTEVTENPDGSIEVVRVSPFSHIDYVSYTAKGRDEKVDRVFQSSGPFVRTSRSGSYLRENHFAKYPDVFEKADRDFREQIARFKPYLKR